MGFKFKRVDLTAGSVDFPIGDTDTLRRTRSETILKKCAEMDSKDWLIQTFLELRAFLHTAQRSTAESLLA